MNHKVSLFASLLLSGGALLYPSLSQANDSSALITGAAQGIASSIPPGSLVTSPLPAPPAATIKGWGYMFSKLESAGIKRQTLLSIFSDPRMPVRDNLYFSLAPKESHYNYRKANSPQARKNALEFYKKHQSSFERAEREFGVPRSVILAILQVETHCGKNVGRSAVLPPLIRLASAADPENIRKNYEAHRARGVKVTVSDVTKRAVWLERTFFQHIVGGIKLAAEMKIHPLDLKGSFAGAIGLPQFLPGHHYNFGVDGNRDGAVDLFVPADAILSVGKYLNNHGWQSKRPPIKQQRAVIAEYNRSIPYIDTVLAMASQLERSLPPAPSAKKGN